MSGTPPTLGDAIAAYHAAWNIFDDAICAIYDRADALPDEEARNRVYDESGDVAILLHSAAKALAKLSERLMP